MGKIVLVEIDFPHASGELLLARLDPQSHAKATRYLREEDQIRSAVASILIRNEVGQGEIHLGSRGKPYIDGKPFFNVSHSGNWVGIYVDNEEIGLDIECISRCDLSIAKAAFTPEETALIFNQMDFALAWTRKEAVGKCLGRGIEDPVHIGLSMLGKNRCAYQGEKYYLQQWVAGDYAFCAAKKENNAFPEPTILRVGDLLKN